MKQVIAFPQLGSYFQPLKKLVINLTNLPVMEMPPITKKTITLGSKYSPDSVCVPFKYNLGNFIEALDAGATILFQAGGGCRYRYYAEVQETILKDLNYQFKLIQIMEKDRLRFGELYKMMKQLNPNLTKRTFLHQVLLAFFYIYYLDKIEDYIRENIGFAENEQSFMRLKNQFLTACNQTNSLYKLHRIYRSYQKKFKKLPLHKPKHCLKVGVIGELYTAMEPFATYQLEKVLASYHIQIKRFTNLSYLLWKKALHMPFMRFKTRKYCKYTLGADGLDNVYRVLWLKKHGYDGIIHTKPSGCTPEIGALPIIVKAAKEKQMPIIFLSFDEQTGVEGLHTRLEAFYDLIQLKKGENK